MNEKHQKNENDQSEKEELTGLQQMAVNPNPAANANIKEDLKSKAEIENAKNQAGSEITDGEGG